MNWINFSSNSSDESVKSRISVGDIVFGIDIFISGKSATRRKKTPRRSNRVRQP